MMVCAVLGCDLLGSDWKNELSEISFLQRVCVLSDRGRVKSSIIQEGLLSVSEQKYTTSTQPVLVSDIFHCCLTVFSWSRALWEKSKLGFLTLFKDQIQTQSKV